MHAGPPLRSEAPEHPCSDTKAVVTAGVDTSTTYYFDGQTHALVEVSANGNGQKRCIAGPTPPLEIALSCTSSMP